MTENGLSLQAIRAAARDLLQVVENHREQVWDCGTASDLGSLQGFVRWFTGELRIAAGLDPPKDGDVLEGAD